MLASHVGPISGIVAKKPRSVRTACTLYLLLAEHVESKFERARFLRNAGF